MKITKFFKTVFYIFFALVNLLIITVFISFKVPVFQELVLPHFYEEETIFTDGYSFDAWKKIGKKDSMSKVIKLLGEPFNKTKGSDGLIRWFYSKQGPKDTNYKIRIIVFNDKNKVIKKIRGYYLD